MESEKESGINGERVGETGREKREEEGRNGGREKEWQKWEEKEGERN